MEQGAQDLSSSSVGQILIPVTDLEKAVPYYRDMLGLKFLFSAPPQMSFFQCGDVRLLVGVPEGTQLGRGSMIYFKVTDIQGVHAELARRGVDFVGAPHCVHRAVNYELWLAEFKDPDGNHLALMAEVPKSA